MSEPDSKPDDQPEAPNTDDSLATVPPIAPMASLPSLPAVPQDRAQLRMALRILQSEAWHRGQRVLVETYRECYAALRSDTETFQELVANEIALREALGDTPRLEEYLQRLPEIEPWLRKQFAVHEAVRPSLRLAAPPSLADSEALSASLLTTGPTPVRADPSVEDHTLRTDSALAAFSLPGAAPPSLADSEALSASLLTTGPTPSSARRSVGEATLRSVTREAAPRAVPATAPVDASPPTRPPNLQVTQHVKKAGPPVHIPGYEILGILGRGGMGVVYKARQIGLNRLVALKMILGGAHVGPDELVRFRAEAEAVARLKHANIVQIHDIGEVEGRPYFSLEFVGGGSLDKRLGGTPLPDREAAELIETLARAMHSAHQVGIIHRDLKPANILLSAADDDSETALHAPSTALRAPKITDFGLAKRLEAEDGQTRSGAIMGTPSYMAPEQAAGHIKEIGPAADVYALGAILYEALVGRPPFKGATVWDTLEQVRTREPVPPARLQARVSRDLETICLKCLDKDPKRRYASAEALADDLARFRNNEPILARPVGYWEWTVKWAKRKPLAAVLAGSLLAFAVILVGSFIGYQIYLRAAVERAEAKVRELTDRERETSTRREALDFLTRGQAAFQSGDWAAARLHLGNAKARTGPEPALIDLRQEIAALWDDANRYDSFTQYHNTALFHATLFTTLDTATNLEKTRDAARHALSLFSVQIDSDTPPAVESTHFTATQKAAIRENCYTLLLVLADATAYFLPQDPPAERRAHARQALPILERAGRMGIQTRAYHLRRARYLAQQGDEEHAAQERDQARALKPTSAIDWFLTGEDATQRGNLPQAQRDFEQALQLQPDHYWAQCYHAIGCLRLQKPAEAKIGLTACISRRPDFALTYLMRGFAHGELAEYDAAEEDFRHVLDTKPDAFTLYGVFANRGVMRIRQGKLTDALSDLRRAIEIKPNNFQAYVSLAQALQTQRQYKDAIAELTEAAKHDPRQPVVYRFRARLHLDAGELDAALADFEQAIKHEPAGARSLALIEDHVARGKIYQQKKEHAQAVAAFDDALKLRPDYAPAHRLRAESLLILNRLPEAILSLNMYLAKEKPVAEVYRARAQAKAKLNHLADAVDDYTRALELEPDPISYSQRGWSYLLAYDAPKLALRDFEAALRMDSKHADACNGRGTCRVLLGAYQLAVADAEEAVKRAPEAPRLIYKAARIYALAVGKLDPEVVKGDRKAADLRTKYLERALALMHQTFALLPPEQRAPFWKQLVETDAALASIRKTPGFYKLTTEYGRSASK